MDILIVIIVFAFFAWLVIYCLYSAKLEAACNKTRSKRLRNTARWLLAATYIFSMIIVALGFFYKIYRLFSNRGDNT